MAKTKPMSSGIRRKIKKSIVKRMGQKLGLNRYKRYSKYVPRPVKQYVKAMISRNVETKQCIPIGANNLPIRGYGIVPNGPHQLTTLDIGQIFDGMLQGTANGERLGNEIRIKKLTLKGFINLDSTKAEDATYLKNPMFVKMFVGRRKDTMANPNTYATTSYTAFQDLFEAGPLVGFPDNLPTDMYQTINNETYQIVARRFFKIGTSAPSNQPSGSAQWNNDFSFSKYFSIDLTKHVNVIKYEPDMGGGGVHGEVRNWGLYAWFLVCFANGATIDPITNNTPLEYHYNINATYEDA